MKIVLKMPSRNRPDKIKDLLPRYVGMASGVHELEFRCTFDLDDPTMNNPEMIAWLEGFRGYSRTNTLWWFGNSKTKIEASNANLEDATGDIIIMLADDMIPVMQDWDDIIAAVFQAHIPDGMGAVKFWDGLRPKSDPLMCLQILGFPLFRRIGHFFHPDYRSVFCDNELTEVCQQLGKYVMDDRCIIRHEWNREHFDYVRERTEDRATKNADHLTYHRRKKENFGI